MEPAGDYLCVLVTAPSLNVARKLAAAALNQRVTACANLIPRVESHYWWQGNLESSAEVLIVFKTTREKLEPLEKCVLANHPYDTPEIVALDLHAGNAKYLSWIAGSTGQNPG